MNLQTLVELGGFSLTVLVLVATSVYRRGRQDSEETSDSKRIDVLEGRLNVMETEVMKVKLTAERSDVIKDEILRRLEAIETLIRGEMLDWRKEFTKRIGGI